MPRLQGGALSRTLDLLNELRRGVETTLERLRSLLEDRVEEDLYLDYKSGKLWKEGGLGSKLQRYVAGFANGDGGVLMIGVAEPTERGARRVFDPVDGDREAILKRARDLLVPLHPHLNPPPRYFGVEVEAGQTVLVIAVDASLDSVLCIERQQPVYYLRMHDSTQPAPAYLVEDIRLGRRRRPRARIEPNNVQGSGRELTFDLNVVNTGLIWLDEPHVGVVGYWLSRSSGIGVQVAAAEGTILEQLEPESGERGLECAWLPVRTASGPRVPPYTAQRAIQADGQSTIRVQRADSGFWYGAVVLVCRDQPPLWFQLVAWTSAAPRSHHLKVLPLAGARPRVGTSVQVPAWLGVVGPPTHRTFELVDD